MTERLYNIDSYIFEFEAEVISCEKQGDYYITVLDKTAFFPEGGGQSGDTGHIANIKIFDTKEINGVIYHYSNEFIAPQKNAFCMLDKELRLRKMQNHTGEHIISGITHTLFGCENVGFHLGKDDMTMDYDKELSKEDILKIEFIANTKIAEDRDIIVTYPNTEELKNITYRSKLELTEDVRIVTIDSVDCCACCAPHVKTTGAVGIIKITDFIRYKGGMRLHARCGLDALDVFREYQQSIEKLSALLSAKRHEVYDFAEKFYNELSKKDQKIYELNRRIIDLELENIDFSQKNICVFFEDADIEVMRSAANKITENFDGFCVLLSGDEGNYKFIIANKNGGVRDNIKNITLALNGKGGGNDQMATGMFSSSRKNIEEFFKTF